MLHPNQAERRQPASGPTMPTRLRTAAAIAIAAALAGCSLSSDPAKVIADARAAIEQRNTGTAEIQLKDLLQRDQNNSAARMLLARVHVLNGDLQSAEKEYRRALEAGADRNEAVPPLLEAVLQTGGPQKVLDEAATLAVESPAARAQVETLRGRAYLALRKPEDARKSFEQALAAKPDHAAAKAGLIALVAQQGNIDRAAAQAADLLKQAPDSPDALNLVAELDLGRGRVEAARDTLTRLVQVAPHSAPARAKLAATLIDLKQFDLAKAELDALGKLAPGSPGYSHLLGVMHLRRGEIPAAREAVQNALRSNPDYLPAVALAASVALAENNPAQAERHARILVDRAPESLQGHRLLAATYLRMNATDRALQTAQTALSRSGDDPQLLAIAGEAALKQNDFARASQYYEKAARLEPNDPGKRTGLALSRLSAGDRERGFADLEAAAQLDTTSFQADYTLIAARLRERQFDQALAAIDALEKKQPRNPMVQNLRGAALAAKGDSAGARKAFEAALAMQPTFFPAASNLAMLDLQSGRPDDARKRFETVLAADPKNVQALLALAQHTARHGGKKEQVRDYLDRARDADRDALAPLVALAGWHLDNGAPRDAVTLLQEAQARDANRPELLNMLAIALARAGDRAQALETYDRLLRTNPDSAALQLRVGEARAALGDDAGALAAFRRAADLQPKAPEPRVALVNLLMRQGKKNEARQVVAALRKDLPGNPAGLLLEGDLAAADQKWLEAADFYRKANGVARSQAATIRHAQALMRGGRDADADNVLRTYIKDAPDDMAARLLYGELLSGRSRWSDAAEQYRHIVSKDPRNVVALNNLAWALHQVRDPKAVELAEQAFALAPKSAPIVDTLGVIRADRGDATRGVELLRQAVALAPKEPRYRLHLAEALVKQGDKGAAREHVDAVLRDFPSGPHADAARDLGRRL